MILMPSVIFKQASFISNGFHPGEVIGFLN
jgi:hypothetical protein